jgi:Uma2 family endonuclease
MTARQYLMLGEDPPGIRLELVDGEVAVSPSPRPSHSYADMAFTALLWAHIEANNLGLLLGDTDTVFGEHDVRRPDLLYFKRHRQHLVDALEAIEAMPDLCIEIVSPSSGTIDRRDKFEQYANAGVPYYWILDPAKRSLEGFELSAGQYRVAGMGQNDEEMTLPPFPNLVIPLKKLWFPNA